MATKRDILLQAARQLGDQSDDFVTEWLAPAFDFVMADLAAKEAIEAVRSSTTFTFVQDRRNYETREICGLTPHYPGDILSLTVWAWGLEQGRIHRAETPHEFENLRMVDGEDKRGKPQIWRLYPNHQTLQVHPPADADNAVACEIAFIRPWKAIGLDDDVLDIQQEDIECIALGIQVKGESFSEQLTAVEKQALKNEYALAKNRMWGRRNVRAGRIRLQPVPRGVEEGR